MSGKAGQIRSETCSKLPVGPGFQPWLLSIICWSCAPCGGGRCQSLGVVLPGVSGWAVWSQASLHAGLFALKQQMPRSAARWPWRGVELPWDSLIPGRGAGDSLLAFPWICLGAMGDCKSIQMKQLLLPALEAVGGQLHLGVFQGTFSPATPLGEVISNDGKPTMFLLGFPADREILFTFFLKEFFFSWRREITPD